MSLLLIFTNLFDHHKQILGNRVLNEDVLDKKFSSAAFMMKALITLDRQIGATHLVPIIDLGFWYHENPSTFPG